MRLAFYATWPDIQSCSFFFFFLHLNEITANPAVLDSTQMLCHSYMYSHRKWLLGFPPWHRYRKMGANCVFLWWIIRKNRKLLKRIECERWKCTFTLLFYQYSTTCPPPHVFFCFFLEFSSWLWCKDCLKLICPFLTHKYFFVQHTP